MSSKASSRDSCLRGLFDALVALDAVLFPDIFVVVVVVVLIAGGTVLAFFAFEVGDEVFNGSGSLSGACAATVIL